MPIVSLLFDLLSTCLLRFQLVLKSLYQQVCLFLEILPHPCHSQEVRGMQIPETPLLMNPSGPQFSRILSLMSSESNVSDFRAHCRLLSQARHLSRLGYHRASESLFGVPIAAGRDYAFLALDLRCFASALRTREAPRSLLENKTDGFDCPQLPLLEVSLSRLLKHGIVHPHWLSLIKDDLRNFDSNPHFSAH